MSVAKRLIMDTRQFCCLRYVSSFLGVFSSDLLPKHPIALSGFLIVNTDSHTESGSHWLAIHFQSQSHSSYYFDSYLLPSYILSYNRSSDATTPYGTTTPYSCRDLLVLSAANIAVSSHCTWAEVNPKQFIGLLATANADKLVSDIFESEFGPLRNMPREGQCSGSRIKT